MDVNELTRQAVERPFFLMVIAFSFCAGGAGHRPGLRRGLHRPHGIGLPRSSRRRSPCHGVSIHRHLSSLSLPFLSRHCRSCLLLWWSLHTMPHALSGPGVCPSGRFVSRHQNGSLGRRRHGSFVSAVSQLLASGLHCPLGKQGASHAACIRFTEVEATFRSSFRKASWFHASNGQVGCCCSGACNASRRSKSLPPHLPLRSQIIAHLLSSLPISSVFMSSFFTWKRISCLALYLFDCFCQKLTGLFCFLLPSFWQDHSKIADAQRGELSPKAGICILLLFYGMHANS